MKTLDPRLIEAIAETKSQGPPSALVNQVSSWCVAGIREIKDALALACKKLQDTHANCPEDCTEAEMFNCPECSREGSKGLECWMVHFKRGGGSLDDN